MRVLCIGYRAWAKEIYNNLNSQKKVKIYKHYKKKGLKKKIEIIKPNIILFYGWSWKIPKNIYQNYLCFMLHPSLLPKFRGGSPIQNQIIRNVTKSGVTIFKINGIIDGGDIYYQKKISLTGTLDDIFKKIVKYGITGTNRILTSKSIKIKKQNHKMATIYRRRRPEESEITIKELKNKPPHYIYNKIRMLEDPYPNAFFKIKSKKLFIKKFIIK